jgi:hypothetical protein
VVFKLFLSFGALNNSYTPIMRKTREEKMEEIKKNFTMLASIITGKVGVPNLPVARQMVKSETNHVLSVAAKKNMGLFSSRTCSILVPKRFLQ